MTARLTDKQSRQSHWTQINELKRGRLNPETSASYAKHLYVLESLLRQHEKLRAKVRRAHRRAVRTSRKANR